MEQRALEVNLSRAIQDLEGTAIGDPLAVAEMQMTLGESLLGLGAADQAIPLFLRARETRTAKLGPDHPQTLTSMSYIAWAYTAAGKLDLAVPLGEKTFKLSEAKLGPDHLDTLKNAQQPRPRRTQGSARTPRQSPGTQRLRDAQFAKLGSDHPDTLGTLNNLAMAYVAARRLPEAIALLERVRDVQIARLVAEAPRYPEHAPQPRHGVPRRRQAPRGDRPARTRPRCQDRQARPGPFPYSDDAHQPRGGIPGRRQAFRGDHPYKDAGRLKEAIQLLEEAHQAAKQFPTLRWVANPLIDAYMKAGENTKLANLLRDQLAEARKTLPKDSPPLAAMLAQFGLSLLEQKNWPVGRVVPPRLPDHPREAKTRRVADV